MLALGIETESDEVRKDMMKRLDRQKIETAFKNMRDAGIRSFAFFIFGYPGETPESLDRTTHYAVELDPDFANFYPAVPYPGTRSVREGRPRRAPRDDDWTRMEYSYYLLRGPRPRRTGRDGRDQPRQAQVLPAPILCGAPPRRSRPPRRHQAQGRLADRVTHAPRRARRGDAAAAKPGDRNTGVTEETEGTESLGSFRKTSETSVTSGPPLPPCSAPGFASGLLRADATIAHLATLRPTLKRLQIAQLLQVTHRFAQVHLALARRAAGEDVRHFDQRRVPGRARATRARS